MAEILLSIAAKVMEYLVEPAIQHGEYLFHVGKIIKNLEDEKTKLTLTKENVLNRAEEAKKKTEKIENVVENWLNKVTNLLAEVENLQLEMNENNSCCQGRIPNWRRYHSCRQMAKKTKIMIELNKNCKFEIFSRLATLPGIEYFSGRNFISFESTQLAFNQLLEAIQDDKSYMIGLYGMGGCGKTTLVKEVGRKTRELNLFDRVAFATVSQTPNIRKIQGELADLLGVKLDEETEAGRARRLSLKLQNGERILVILDDVWSRVNLEEIGIPFNESQGACKVVLTTRRQQVCTLMDCQRKIPLGLLSEEEAMVLFQKHAKIDDDSSSSLLNELAWGVVRECKGLPLAIEVVGTSLKGKSIDDWRIALDRLKNSKPIDIEEGLRDVFACLQLSYDYLASSLTKSLLLICSLFPEDHEIPIEDLFRYGLGVGLCGEVESFDMARSQMNASINKLIDSCLLMHPQRRIGHVKLLDTVTHYDEVLAKFDDDPAVSWHEERTDRVKMHDLVRDMSLRIASQEGRAMMVNTLRNMKAKSMDCFAISLWNEEIRQLHDQMDAPKVEILLLQPDSETELKLSNVFFGGMKGLKVMNIINEDYHDRPLQPLAQSTHLLTNLRILRLVRWQLGDISFVVNLRRLEILDLNGSHFKGLPNGIEKLSGLKLLDLSWCEIEVDCHQVIAGCSQLEELYTHGSGIYRQDIDSYECFLDVDTFPKLRRYSFEFGRYPERWQDLGFPSLSRFLHIHDFNISTSGAIIKDLLKRSEAVRLFKGGCNNLVPEIIQAVGGFNELTSLVLFDLEMEFLINTTSDQADSFQEDASLPRLLTLLIADMSQMKQVCHGPPPLGFFEKLKGLGMSNCWMLQSIFPRECKLCNLKKLTINYCKMLTSLFPISVARTLLLLQQLDIQYCDEMKEIITNEGENNADTENSRFVFPKLRILKVNRCKKLGCIFPIFCAEGLLQLEILKITNSSGLKYVFGQSEHDIHSTCQIDVQIKLPLLKHLRLKGLPNLLSIFSDNYEPSWPSLRKLTREYCPRLTLPETISPIQN